MTLFSDPFWAELLSLANIVFGVMLAAFSFGRAKRARGFLKVSQILIGMIGLYWAGLYLFVFVTPAGTYDPILFGRYFVRPMFTLTMGIMAANGLYRWRMGRA